MHLFELLKRIKTEDEILASCQEDTVCIRKCLITGYFSNAAQLGNDGLYKTIRGSVTVGLHPQSVFAKFGRLPEWIIFHDIVHAKSSQLREVTKIDPKWLIEIAPHYYSIQP